MKKKIVMFLLRLSVKISGTVYHKSGITTDGCFRTFSGAKFSILEPSYGTICIDDIARGLATKPHFAGHTPDFFSIASHSLLVEKLVAIAYPEDYGLRLMALLHDASEAYLGDVIKPLKNLLPNFEIIEENVERTIFERYSLDPSWMKIVKPYDIVAQDYESSHFKNSNAGEFVKYRDWADSEKEFLSKFYFLNSKYTKQ